MVALELLQAYSRGEITRHEIEEQSQQAISFGTLLGMLHQHRLPLPRFRSDPQSVGVGLIRQLAERAKAHAR